jgi:hypothetical protein
MILQPQILARLLHLPLTLSKPGLRRVLPSYLSIFPKQNLSDSQPPAVVLTFTFEVSSASSGSDVGLRQFRQLADSFLAPFIPGASIARCLHAGMSARMTMRTKTGIEKSNPACRLYCFLAHDGRSLEAAKHRYYVCGSFTRGDRATTDAGQ